jgi:hypothetical protein
MLSKVEHHAEIVTANSNEFIPNTSHKKLLGVRVSALIEIIGFLTIALLIDYLCLDGSRYISVQPHPFWVIVLLVCTQYGTTEGLFAAFLSSAVLLAWNLPEQQLDQSIYDYLLVTIKQPLMWLSAAVVLGEVRMRHIKERNELSEELATAREHEHAISDAYTSLKRMKEKLETHMAGELQSSVNAYNAMKSLGTLNPSKILLGVEEVVKAVMDPEKFSVYALGPEGLESAICVGWKQDELYSRRFANTSTIYKEIVGRQRMLCCINDNDAKMLGTEGLIAAPLIDTETGNVFGMLKIEDIGFSKLTLSNVESFRILCEVTGLAHSNAEKYRQAEINSIINQENDLFSYTFFQQQNALFSLLANITSVTPSVISLKLSNLRQFSTKDKALLAEKIKEVIHQKIHDVFQLFNGKKIGAEFYILLPSTSEDRLQFAMKEIQKSFKEATDPLLTKARIEIGYKALGVRKDITQQVINEQPN